MDLKEEGRERGASLTATHPGDVHKRLVVMLFSGDSLTWLGRSSFLIKRSEIQSVVFKSEERLNSCFFSSRSMVLGNKSSVKARFREKVDSFLLYLFIGLFSYLFCICFTNKFLVCFGCFLLIIYFI